jgi:hypothetical protein
MMTFQSRGFTLMLHQVTLFLKEKLKLFFNFLEHFQNTLLHICIKLYLNVGRKKTENLCLVNAKILVIYFKRKIILRF